MNTTRKIFRTLAVLQTIIIVFLVYYGRTFVNAFLASFQSSGFTNAHIYLLAAGIAAPVLGIYYVFLIRKIGLIQALLHLVILMALGGVTQWMMVQPVEVTHIPIYGSLAIFWFLSLPGDSSYQVKNQRCILVTLLICAAVAGVDEILQAIHPERYGDWHDFSINMASTMIGMLLVIPFKRSQ